MSTSHLLMRLRGRIQTLIRRCQPFYFGALLKFRTRLGNRECEAIVPFDTRMWYQNIVVHGTDGFLFHQDHDVIDQLTGGIVLRQRQIDVWLDALRARTEWCVAHGSLLRHMIVPEKHVVYARHLPRYVGISANRPVVRLLRAFEDGLSTKILYPLDPLRDASRDRPTFLRTDTHWTSYGAFVAYRHLMASLAEDLPLPIAREGDFVWKEHSFVGDIGVRFDPERGETISVPEAPATYKLVFQNNQYGRGAIHVYENENRDLPRCVLFRDSFSSAMIPFLMHGFSRLVMVSSLSCHYDLLEREKPDVVLFVAIERFMATFGLGVTIQLPEDAARIPFETQFGTGLDCLQHSAR